MNQRKSDKELTENLAHSNQVCFLQQIKPCTEISIILKALKWERHGLALHVNQAKGKDINTVFSSTKFLITPF